MILFESTDVIPIALTEEVRQMFLEKPALKSETQCQADFYDNQSLNREIFNWLPSKDESYTAAWDSYADCKEHPAVKAAIFNHILPKFEEFTGVKHETYADHTLNLRLSLTKMPPGGHYRIHNDEYACRYGFIWYLNNDWKWDWGGLLLTVNEDGSANVIRPIYNNLIFLDHVKSNNNWHCVTRVESFAKEPRMSIIGFIK
jgi:Rps23 Pro-64 3,4-dihydroxylase Tpa1-like proline 4-hydroxylase